MCRLASLFVTCEVCAVSCAVCVDFEQQLGGDVKLYNHQSLHSVAAVLMRAVLMRTWLSRAAPDDRTLEKLRYLAKICALRPKCNVSPWWHISPWWPVGGHLLTPFVHTHGNS